MAAGSPSTAAEGVSAVGVLDEILEHKRSELMALRALEVPIAPPARALPLRRTEGEPLRLLAEIKRRSPSAGALSTTLGVADRARTYEAAGADAISVLTDERYFDGAWAHLAQAREATSLPILCKDFVIDESQLRAARAFGADAVLLIVRCLEPPRLAELIAAALELQLQPLVEVTDVREADVALEAGASLIGVNARDLHTLKMSPDRAAQTLAALPSSVTRIHLSGIASPADVAAIARSGVDGALVGEALMRQEDPTELLRALRRQCG